MHAKPTRTRRRESLSNQRSISKSARLNAIRRASFIKSSFVEPLERRVYLTAPIYNWQNVNIGAGGFVDGIFYDPHNQNTIYARTDIGGLYKSTNDGTSWTQLLDFVGNSSSSSGNGTQAQEIGVLSFAIDPENSNNLYADVGEYSGTNGNVLYSTNGGATWSTTALSFYVGGNSNGRGDGEQIAVDPNDSNIVFLGTNDHGLWESTNAGHSFTRISTSVFTPTSTTFVLFNPSGTVGSPSQTIYVGIDSTSTGTNLYQTTNGGTSWAQITGTGTLPTGYLPGHGVISNGYIYLGYANAEAPSGSITNGGVYRYQISTGTWASISPVATAGKFGYDAVAADPSNPNTVVVTSFDDYSGPDQMWRTVNANAATPTWTEVYDYSTAQNFGYNGYDASRNSTNAPWDAAFGDGIGNWAATVAINPFNSNQLMYGTGQGIWATNNISNGGANTKITAPNSWYFPDTGIEFTAVGSVAATTGGVPLYSAMGDIGGFAHTTLAFSPAQGSAGTASTTATDYAGAATNDAVLLGTIWTTDGGYTTNGSTFTGFSTNPGGGTTFSGGTIAISANGSTIVWAPSSQTAYYSTNNGASWTKSTLGASGALPTGGKIVSDKVNPNDFYYWTENTSDNSWTLYISSDGGHTFNASAGGSLGTGNATLVANQFVAGQLWLGTYGGVYESTNFGASFTHSGSFSDNISSNDFAVGAAAPGNSVPSLYMYGIPSGKTFQGIYRSDDGGNTWLLLNDTAHQWGGLIQTLSADPNVFGRLYIGVNGRGIIMGNPLTTLPAGWTDTDINEPGNPGWSSNSTPLSTGSTSTQWYVAGGGVNIAAAPVSITSLGRTGGVATAVTSTANNFQVGQTITISGANQSVYDGTFVITSLGNTTAGLSSNIGSATQFTFAIAQGTDSATGTITATLADQFNYAYESIAGNATISAQVQRLTNADNGSGTPQAGVMYRASTSPTDPFIALVQTTASTIVLEYRTSAGGSVTTNTLSSIPVGEYLEIVRSGSNFQAMYSSDGNSWTGLGSAVTISSMPGTANVGLVAGAGYNPQLTDASFANVNVVVNTGPTIVNPAAANPNPVTGTSTTLSALGSENGSGSGLTYTWAYTGPTGVTYTGATNGTNAAQNITANFTQAGTYNFTVTITDASNQSIQSPISVTVNQTPTTVGVSPSTTTTIPVSTSQGYTVSVADQFGNSMSASGVVWSITGSSNSITAGNATLGSTPGSFTVTATDGSAHGDSTLIGENFAIPVASTLDINLGSAGLVALTESGSTITASQNGVQISFTAMTTIAVTDTASGDELDVNSSISEPFTISGADSATLDVNTGSITFAAVEGGAVNLGVLSIAAGASAAITPTTSQQPTTLNVADLAVAPTGQLDIANNVVVISYGSNPDPITSIAALLTSGYNNGLWNGAGIISTIAQTQTKYALGYADSADPGNPAGLANQTIKIMYTLIGDADLNGTVNGIDFGILAANLNKTVSGWDQGDFDFNGIVNGLDFTALSSNFNQADNIAAAVVVSAPTNPTPATPPAITSTNPTTTPTPPVTHKHTIVKNSNHRIR
jgi:hypothetical protein